MFFFLSGNEYISLCCCLQTQFVSYLMEVVEYAMYQFDEQEFTSNEHALSMIKLVHWHICTSIHLQGILTTPTYH